MTRLILIIFALFTFHVSAFAASSHIDLPVPFDLVMLAGGDFSLTLKSTDELGSVRDLTGHSFTAQFRSASAPAGILYAQYSTAIVTPESGLFQVSLNRFKTLTLSGKTGVWDLFQVDPTGKVTYLIGGKAAVRPTATRP